MISKTEKETILRIAKNYSLQHLYLFGSATLEQNSYNDIDLAVEGLNSSDFFSFYGDLLFSLSLPVDLIDLDNKSSFTKIIQQDGLILV